MFKGYWIVADVDGTLTPTPSKSGGKYYSLSMSATVFGKAKHYHSCLPLLRYFIARGGNVCAVSTAGRRLWWQLYNDLATVLYPAASSLLLSSSMSLSLSRNKAQNNQNNEIEYMQCIDDAKLCTSKLEESKKTMNEIKFCSEPGRLLLCGFTGAALFRSRLCEEVRNEIADRMTEAHSDNHTQHENNTNKESVVVDDDGGGRTDSYPPAFIGLEEWIEYRQTALGNSNTTMQTSKGVELEIKNNNNNNVFQEMSADCANTTTMNDHVSDIAAHEGRAALIRFFEHVSYISRHDVNEAHDFFSSCLSAKYHNVYTHLLESALQELSLQNIFNRDEMNRNNIIPHLCFEKCTVFDMSKLNKHGYYLVETNDALVDYQRIPEVTEFVQPLESPSFTTTTTTVVTKESSLSRKQHQRTSATMIANVGQIVVMGIPSRYFHLIFPTAAAATRSLEEKEKQYEQENHSSDSKSEANYTQKEKCNLGSASSVHEHITVCQCCPQCAQGQYHVKDKLHRLGLELKQQPNSVCIHKSNVDKSRCVRWLCKHANELDFDLTHALAFGDVPESVDRPLTLFAPMQFISLAPHSPYNTINKENTKLESVFNAEHVHYVGGEEEGTAIFLEELFNDIQTSITTNNDVNGEDDAALNNKRNNYFCSDRVTRCAEKARRRVEELDQKESEEELANIAM